MAEIKIFPSQVVSDLYDKVDNHLGYYHDSKQFPDEIMEKAMLIGGDIDVNYDKIIEIATSQKKKTDEEISLAEEIRDQLPITRAQAINEGLWVYLAHGPLKEVARIRLLKSKKGGKEKKIKAVQLRYFIPSDKRAQNLLETHAISKHWWRAEIAGQANIFSREEALQIMLKMAGYRNIRFHGFLRFPNVINAILKIGERSIKKGAEPVFQKKFSPQEEGKTRKRSWLDEISIYFHRASSTRFLAGLSAEQIQTILEDKLQEMGKKDYQSERKYKNE